MLTRVPAHQEVDDLRSIDTIELLWRCTADREKEATWSEFLRRIVPRLERIIGRTLRQSAGNPAVTQGSTYPGMFQQSDMVQQVILRLVAGDCALLRRFSGSTEDDLIAYLAVISRSVVRDSLRRQSALKRRTTQALDPLPEGRGGGHCHSQSASSDGQIERRLLARELADIGSQVLKDSAAPSTLRDKLIFQLYFFHDLSLGEIARCRGINLSKAGVDRVLNRLKERIKILATAPKAEVVQR